MSNDFLDDKQRQIYVEKDDVNSLKNSYFQKSGKNPNTQKFWDKSITYGLTLKKIDPMTRDRIRTVIKLIKKDKKNLLDLGLGYGFLETELTKKRRNLKLSGIDISKEAIKLIRKKSNGTFKLGKVTKIPFKEKFDVIVALEVLEHIRATEVFSVYREITRLIKRNGQLIISVPINEKYTNHYNPNKHMRRYTKELIIAELKLAGFKIINSKLLFAFDKLYLFKKALSMILVNKWKPNVVILEVRKK